MANEELKELLNKDKIIAGVKKLCTPIDFEELEKKGILVKQGAWYKILEWDRFPEYAQHQISAFRSNGDYTVSVRFYKTRKSTLKLYKKLTGKEFELENPSTDE